MPSSDKKSVAQNAHSSGAIDLNKLAPQGDMLMSNAASLHCSELLAVHNLRILTEFVTCMAHQASQHPNQSTVWDDYNSTEVTCTKESRFQPQITTLSHADYARPDNNSSQEATQAFIMSAKTANLILPTKKQSSAQKLHT